ncbi:Mov34/MPN/PAD-1 family protein [Blastomonas sp.]|uniref:Mov34/MPN/PAD-1 family protein n=1 Tax=Blastomonas sp. TaxID=1909299 RepID=UPI003593407C
MLLDQARAAHPLECCGLLLGEGGVVCAIVPTANVADNPARHFEIDPAMLIAAERAMRQGGAQLIGYYHSHPDGLARPSARDAAASAGDGRLWLIIGGDHMTAWLAHPHGFDAIDLKIAP